MLSFCLGTVSLETYQCSSVSSQTKAKQLCQELEVVWHQDAPNHEVLPIYSFLEKICLKWDVVHQPRPLQRVVGHRINNILCLFVCSHMIFTTILQLYVTDTSMISSLQ